MKKPYYYGGIMVINNPEPKPNFRNKAAQEWYDRKASHPSCIESGIDNQGQIYFVFANGIVERYTRREALQEAKHDNDQ